MELSSFDEATGLSSVSMSVTFGLELAFISLEGSKRAPIVRLKA